MSEFVQRVRVKCLVGPACTICTGLQLLGWADTGYTSCQCQLALRLCYSWTLGVVSGNNKCSVCANAVPAGPMRQWGRSEAGECGAMMACVAVRGSFEVMICFAQGAQLSVTWKAWMAAYASAGGCEPGWRVVCQEACVMHYKPDAFTA